jgi:hypothetical protein
MKKRNRKGTLLAHKHIRKNVLRADTSQWNEYIEM